MLSIRAPLSSAAPLPAPASVFQPKEHGSWSLALEPLALGLCVAPSAPATALAIATLAGFFARRPLRDAFAPTHSEQRMTARESLVMLSALAVGALGEVVILGEWQRLWPLLLALPLGAVFLAFDLQRRSRAALAEIAGSAAFAFVPAALVSLAGWSPRAALGLAAVALARSVPTVLSVREGLRVTKGKGGNPLLPVLAAFGAVFGLGALAAQHWLPAPIIIVAGVLLLRAIWFASALRPAWSARRIGIFEAVLGVLYVAAVAMAYRS